MVLKRKCGNIYPKTASWEYNISKRSKAKKKKKKRKRKRSSLMFRVWMEHFFCCFTLTDTLLSLRIFFLFFLLLSFFLFSSKVIFSDRSGKQASEAAFYLLLFRRNNDAPKSKMKMKTKMEVNKYTLTTHV